MKLTMATVPIHVVVQVDIAVDAVEEHVAVEKASRAWKLNLLATSQRQLAMQLSIW